MTEQVPGPTTEPEEQPKSEASVAAETTGIGAGAGGTEVLEQISSGNSGAFNGGAAKNG